MHLEQVNSDQKRLGRRSQEDCSDELICARCQVVMSRRSIGKPDSETGLSEVTYRCPQCCATVNRWMKIS
jgi:hypothetical protein